MHNQKIVFRADGGQDIGMGHFIRTLALAEMLKDDFCCIYATKSPSVYQVNEINKVCRERIDLPNDENHFNVFLNHLKGNEIVVLDNYYFKNEYQQLIKNIGCKLVCIDDMHDRHFVADIIINHAEGVNESQYSAEKFTTFCLGYKFALLRQDYLSDDYSEIQKQYSCLVMMGGTDIFNLTAKIISMIEPIEFPMPIAIIVGADYAKDHVFQCFNNVELFKGIESTKIIRIMKESQFGIFPASTVAIEACAARLPFICGYYVDNQREIYNGIESNNLALCIGNFLKAIPNDYVKSIERLNQEGIVETMVENQKKLLDKKSKERFVKIFNQLWESE